MSNANTLKRFPTAEFEHFTVQGSALDHETMTKTELPPIAVLVNVNHDDPETFAERQYREALKAQGFHEVGSIRIDSYGTDGVSL